MEEAKQQIYEACGLPDYMLQVKETPFGSLLVKRHKLFEEDLFKQFLNYPKQPKGI